LSSIIILYQWPNYCFPFTITVQNNVLVYEKNEDIGYTVYELSGENAELIGTYNIAIDEIFEVFDGYEEYSFLYSNSEGLFGYDISNEKTDMITDANGRIVNAEKKTDDRLCVTYSVESSDANKVLINCNGSESISEIEYDKNTIDMFLDKNGNFNFIYLDTEEDKTFLKIKDKENNIIDKIELCSGEDYILNASLNNNMICFDLYEDYGEKKKIIIINTATGNTEHIIDLMKYKEVSNKDIADIYYNNENIYLYCEGKIYKIDSENKIINVKQPESHNNTGSFRFLNTIDDYEVCYRNDKGIFGLKNNECFELVDWNKCDVDFVFMNYIHLCSDSMFYAIGSTDGNTEEAFVFNKNSGKEAEEKKLIRISGVDIGTSDTESESKRQFINMIKNFNNSSDEIRVELCNYLDYESLQLDMMSDKKPDILYMAEGDDKFSDVLVDLTEYISREESINNENYFMNIFNLKDTKKISSVYASYTTYFMMGKESEIGTSEVWNQEKFIQLIEESSKDKDTLYGMDALDALYISFILNLNSFIDYNENTCSFNTEETLRMMNAIKTAFSSDLDLYDNSEIYEKQLRRFLDNRCKIDFGAMSFPEEYYYIYTEIIGETPAIKGIPSSSGESVIIEPDYSLGIMKDSKYKNESWEIISRILTDDFQESVLFTPVKRSAFLKRFEESGYNYVTKEDIRSFENLISSATVQVFTDIKLTESILEEFQLFIEDKKSDKDVAESIEKKIKIYIGEIQ